MVVDKFSNKHLFRVFVARYSLALPRFGVGVVCKSRRHLYGLHVTFRVSAAWAETSTGSLAMLVLSSCVSNVF